MPLGTGLSSPAVSLHQDLPSIPPAICTQPTMTKSRNSIRPVSGPCSQPPKGFIQPTSRLIRLETSTRPISTIVPSANSIQRVLFNSVGPRKLSLTFSGARHGLWLSGSRVHRCPRSIRLGWAASSPSSPAPSACSSVADRRRNGSPDNAPDQRDANQRGAGSKGACSPRSFPSAGPASWTFGGGFRAHATPRRNGGLPLAAGANHEGKAVAAPAPGTCYGLRQRPAGVASGS